MKRRLTAAGVMVAMLCPKIMDEVEDLFDEDPETLFSWKFMMALLAPAVVAFILGAAPASHE